MIDRLQKLLAIPWARRAAWIAIFIAVVPFLIPGAWMSGFYVSGGFMPHAHCWLRDPAVTWLHVSADLLIWLAYFSISITLGYMVYRGRNEIPFHWMFLAFGLFIVFCGFTHLMAVVTVWRPLYWLSGDIKVMTAVASVATAIALPIKVPQIFGLIQDARSSRIHKENLEAANEELRDLYGRVKESDRLKSQFFANVSHELRTPLSLILGPMRRRLANDNLAPDERRELEVIERNASLLHDQVNNLLDLARLEAGSMKPHYARTDLAQVTRLIGSCFDGLAAERQLAYKVSIPDSMVAEVDPEKIQRVLLNLLSNAFKFTPQHGVIRVSLEVHGNESVFVIEDSGPGIPTHLRERVFERFMQVEDPATRKAGGTGLGLPIAREFVELHGGRILLEDSANGGARFKVSLPLEAPEGETVTETDPDPEEQRTSQLVGELKNLKQFSQPSADEPVPVASDNRPLVLVVEDNPDMNRFLRQALAPHYRTIAAYEGQDGLRQAQRHPPDLIIADIMMPHVSGDMMINELREDPALEEVPVVVLSASAEERNRVGLLKKGADDYITKPFELDVFKARVGGLIRRRQQALDRLNRTLMAILKALPEPVFVRGPNPQTPRQNPAADDFLAGLGNPDRLPQSLQERIQEVLETGDSYLPTNFEGVEHFRLDNEDRYFLPRVVALRTSKQAIVGSVLLLHDVTEFRLLDQVKSNLLGTVSHELKTPVTSMQMSLYLLKDQTGESLSKATTELIGIACEECDHLLNTLSSLLEMTRFQENGFQIHRERTPPQTLVSSALDGMSEKARDRQVPIRTEIEEGLPEIEVDQDRIIRALTNLLTNAMKSSPQGAEIILRLKRQSENSLYFGVRDFGPGVPAEYQGRLFERFYRAPGNQTSGTGLGLAIVQDFVKAHGGTTGVISEPGEGSEFYFELPIEANR